MQHKENDGSVSRETVIKVLRIVSNSAGYYLSIHENEVTVIKDDVPDSYSLPVNVPRKLLHVFCRKYNIKIHFFYHPGMIDISSDSTH